MSNVVSPSPGSYTDYTFNITDHWHFPTRCWLPDSVRNSIRDQLGVKLIRYTQGQDPLETYGVQAIAPVTDRQLALVEIALSEWAVHDVK